MRYAILSALVVGFGTSPAPGGWGASCAPAVAGPRFFAPAMPQFAPVPPAHHGFPVFVAGPGGVCSARCVCGCNAGGVCECNGPAAKPDAMPLVGGGGGSAPPVDPPTGVDAGKLAKEPRYTVGGKSVTRAEALRLVGQLVDDSKLPRLTVVGDPDARKALRSALMADLPSTALLTQDYEPGHWAISKHKCDGLTVYLQQPDGTTLLRETRLTPAHTSGLLDRIKRALGLSPPLPPSPPVPPPAPLGPDGRPLQPDGYSGLALGGTGLLGTLIGLGVWWLRQRMQQPANPAPAPQPAPAQPSAPQLPPTPLQPAPPFDLAILLEQAALDLWRKRMAGTPLGARLEQALAVLRQVIQPQEAPKP